MKNFDQFIVDWLGKKIDFDNYADGQCFDLYRQYVKECLSFPQSGSTGDRGAAILWEAFDQDPILVKYYDKIPNSDTFIPKKGDIAVWNRRFGSGYGHVAVCTGKGDLNTFESFDQNWNKISYCELVTHTYSSFYGVLRPKGIIASTAQPVPDLTEQQKQIYNLQTQVDGLLIDLTQKNKIIDEINGQLTEAKTSSDGFRKQLNEFIAQLANKLGTRQETVEILAAVDTAITYQDKASELDRTLELERKEHTAAITQLGNELAAVKAQLMSLEGKYKELKYSNVTPVQTVGIWSILKSIFIRS